MGKLTAIFADNMLRMPNLNPEQMSQVFYPNKKENERRRHSLRRIQMNCQVILGAWLPNIKNSNKVRK
jgi:hypothetical protein